MKNKEIKSYLTLFIISILVVLILSIILGHKYSFIHRLSNNLFIVGVVFLSVGVAFRLFAWSTHKKMLNKQPMDIEELQRLGNSHKDAVTISNIKKSDELKKRKEVLGLLWKRFMFVGTIDFLLSIVALSFL
ncbi:hypothetical protein KQH90_11680 [Anaerosalibacter bizertensis]|uniref:hypothetical protein n=1 Tax=Anaerosalibacter bizertensis TaxID=932217 RepID=UPI001C0EE074|nr:hypothetical protein [Anaerosalibacter bizertensis]MBU5294688.1 hypothetical protein [Anaerosalibacter bizertensis]